MLYLMETSFISFHVLQMRCILIQSSAKKKIAD